MHDISNDNNTTKVKPKEVKISIIIPVYNTAEYLPQCLDSAINQTMKDIEIIVVDDASTDTACRSSGIMKALMTV